MSEIDGIAGVTARGPIPPNRTAKKRTPIRRSLLAVIFVIATALTACNDTQLFTFLDSLRIIMETPVVERGMMFGSGGSSY